MISQHVQSVSTFYTFGRHFYWQWLKLHSKWTSFPWELNLWPWHCSRFELQEHYLTLHYFIWIYFCWKYNLNVWLIYLITQIDNYNCVIFCPLLVMRTIWLMKLSLHMFADLYKQTQKSLWGLNVTSVLFHTVLWHIRY